LKSAYSVLLLTQSHYFRKKISKVDHIPAIHKWTRLKGYSCSAVSKRLSYSLCRPEWHNFIFNMVAQTDSVDDLAC